MTGTAITGAFWCGDCLGDGVTATSSWRRDRLGDGDASADGDAATTAVVGGDDVADGNAAFQQKPTSSSNCFLFLLLNFPQVHRLLMLFVHYRRP